MNMKKVIDGKNLDELIKESLNILCIPVAKTLGPKGNNVIVSASSLPPFITNDGVTISLNIESDDVCINSILSILKESSIKTNEMVGDGTTTTLVLLKSIMDETYELLNKGISKYEIINRLNYEGKIVENLIRKYSHKPSMEEIRNIVITSSKSKEAGGIIYDVIKNISSIEGVEITTGEKENTEVIYYNGYSMDTSLASPHFFKDRSIIKLKNPYVIVSDETLYSLESLSEVINKVAEEKSSLLIIAADYSQDFIENVLSLNYDEDLNIYLLKNPEFGNREYMLTQDLKEISSCSLFKGKLKYENIGYLKEVVIDKDKTILYFDKSIDEYIGKVDTSISDLKDEFEINYYRKRISMLKDGLAKIIVGGKTISEAREAKMHYDDALSAGMSSKNGVSIGAGFTFLKIAYELKDEYILKKVLCEPFRQILKNANLDTDLIEMKVIFKFDKIYNVINDEYEDITTTGILDPTDVLIETLKNALSIANLLLNTTSLVINEQIKNIDIDHDINI